MRELRPESTEFLGGPVVKIPCFKYQGCRFHPWLGNWDITSYMGSPKKKTNKPESRWQAPNKVLGTRCLMTVQLSSSPLCHHQFLDEILLYWYNLYIKQWKGKNLPQEFSHVLLHILFQHLLSTLLCTRSYAWYGGKYSHVRHSFCPPWTVIPNFEK